MDVQATFDFDPRTAGAADHTGFEIGWDHAHHGLVPPAGLLLDGTPIGQGWRAGKAVFGSRTLAATRHVRQWLALRTEAWRAGVAFEGTQVTPHYLGQIEATHCPVTRQPLGGAAGTPDAAVVARLNPAGGIAAGNLAVVSEAAQSAADSADARELLRRAARVESGIEPPPAGLSVDAAWRVAVLASFATPLPFAEAARVPLRVLPPNRVRVLNAVQGLQALVTRLFAAPGWSARVRELAARLPSAESRHDFNLFVGGFAVRLPAAGADTATVRRTLEDAWGCERVLRRWQAFVLGLGEAAVERLAEGAASAGVAGVRTLVHAPAAATEGWALASRGRVVAARRRGDAVAPRRAAPAAAPARG